MHQLGKGSFGVVHQIRKRLGKYIAIKALQYSEETEDSTLKELEMATTYISRHDHIVTIHEFLATFT